MAKTMVNAHRGAQQEGMETCVLEPVVLDVKMGHVIN